MANERNIKDNLILHYSFDDESSIGKDLSGHGYDGEPLGSVLPYVDTIAGKKAVRFTGGADANSYIKLPSDVVTNITDDKGVTFCGWLYLEKGPHSMWERIVDFGSTGGRDNLFLTRTLRGVCACGEDLVCEPSKRFAHDEWVYFAYTIAGSKGGTLSNAGGTLYINGDLVCDGKISQTTSGKYGKLRKWFASFKEVSNYPNCYIGRSMYSVDPNLDAYMSDFRIYDDALTQDEVIELMCETLTDDDIVSLAKDKYLSFPPAIITSDVNLTSSLMNGRVNVNWTSDNIVLSNDGKVGSIDKATAVTLTATLTRGNASQAATRTFTVLPANLPPYELTINGDDKVLDISNTLWGLFYEDINNAADGGIYAELINNRSFENFRFHNYNHTSGENGITSGREFSPLHAWFGDTDKMIVKTEGGLNDFFNLEDKDINSHYVTVENGATIYNRGFCDSNKLCSMNIISGDNYCFSIWAKADTPSSIDLVLVDTDGNETSTHATISVDNNNWNKYGKDNSIKLTGTTTALSQLKLTFSGDVSIDMVSLFPEKVWGYTNEATSVTAHENYLGNPNYRLRSDLVKSLVDLHPTFLRFPGGCISEGSYIWDNVYDWKDSVDDVELRKENFNVWGYVMTMGLGYMEYFQLAEDLNATPLPVMACGVLCQARSDYANPAGGALQEKYIKNFTDLVDFALSTDFENNVWAKLRKKMGHEKPFDLRYLGVGNENWGEEFMASFEIFYHRITKYIKEVYPNNEITIISTVGAQADDGAYKYGWKFLYGKNEGTANIAFSDGKESFTEEITWYNNQKHYMETIADEHYYRSNNYLLNNADRYNYYFRAYNADGTIDDSLSSKVFVGEYASNDKNTLAGAVAEAAVMTGFENNSDVVRLAATAPLFNKVLTDAQYRWTPDCIWFDNETVWYTPTYYVQQLFAKYIGTKLLSTSFTTYEDGAKYDLVPKGGIEVATSKAKILVNNIKVVSNNDDSVIFESNLNTLPDNFIIIGKAENVSFSENGMTIDALKTNTLTGIACINKAWSNYKVIVKAQKLEGENGMTVGAGVTNLGDEKSAIEYVIGHANDTTGIKVYKRGVEGYTLGDFSSSIFAGNLRSAINEVIESNKEYTIIVDYGTKTGKNLECTFSFDNTNGTLINYKLEAYNDYVFNSATTDDNHIYIKLVNADNFDKATSLTINNASINASAKSVTITADNKYNAVPNVNARGNEIVVPVENTIEFTNNNSILNLPANSVTCVIVNKN